MLAQAEQILTIGRALAAVERGAEPGRADPEAATRRPSRRSAAGPTEAAAQAAGVRALDDKLAGDRRARRRPPGQVGRASRTFGLDLLPADYRRTAGDIALQLVRNAIVHGIERPAERRAAGKPDVGSILIDIVPNVCTRLHAVDARRRPRHRRRPVRARLAASGRFSPERLASMSDREIATRIFDAGFSTRADALDEDAGQGVGLDLVRRLAESLGGAVQVQSRPGRGTSFRVALPPPSASGRLALALRSRAEPPQAGPDATVASECGATDSRAGMKILVVDDSSVMRNRIARIAGARRYEIVGLAKNGLRALELLRTTRPDVVTMDLTMPEMDGVTCTRGSSRRCRRHGSSSSRRSPTRPRRSRR